MQLLLFCCRFACYALLLMAQPFVFSWEPKEEHEGAAQAGAVSQAVPCTETAGNENHEDFIHPSSEEETSYKKEKSKRVHALKTLPTVANATQQFEQLGEPKEEKKGAAPAGAVPQATPCMETADNHEDFIHPSSEKKISYTKE